MSSVTYQFNLSRRFEPHRVTPLHFQYCSLPLVHLYFRARFSMLPKSNRAFFKFHFLLLWFPPYYWKSKIIIDFLWMGFWGFGEQGSTLGHTTRATTRAETATVTAEGDQVLVLTFFTTHTQKTVLQPPAFEKGFKLILHITRQCSSPSSAPRGIITRGTV